MPSNDDSIRAFLDRYSADLEAGTFRTLREYLDLFPEAQEAVANEYLALNNTAFVGRPSARGAIRDSSRAAWPALGEPGSRVGPYRLIQEVGRGGTAVVFLAEDTKIQRRVAIKLLHGAAALSETGVDRLLREAQAAGRLDHPGICAVHQAGIEDGIPFVAMRFVEGESLADRLTAARLTAKSTPRATLVLPDRSAPRPAVEIGEHSTHAATRVELLRIAEMIEHVARALHFAHEAGVVHRDVKPGNIMLDRQGNPVITDFGIARVIDAEAPPLTRTGDLFGTPAYMAPEQIAANRIPIDARVDIWALGVTLYECLTLRRPFEGVTPAELYQQIIADEPVDPRRLNPLIPRDLATVVLTAIQKRPDNRFANALEFAEELRRVRAYEPILSRPVSPWGRLVRWTQRKPGLAGALAALVVILAGGTVVSTAFAIHANERTQAAARTSAAEKVAIARVLRQEGRFADSLALLDEARSSGWVVNRLELDVDRLQCLLELGRTPEVTDYITQNKFTLASAATADVRRDQRSQLFVLVLLHEMEARGVQEALAEATEIVEERNSVDVDATEFVRGAIAPDILAARRHFVASFEANPSCSQILQTVAGIAWLLEDRDLLDRVNAAARQHAPKGFVARQVALFVAFLDQRPMAEAEGVWQEADNSPGARLLAAFRQFRALSKQQLDEIVEYSITTGPAQTAAKAKLVQTQQSLDKTQREINESSPQSISPKVAAQLPFIAALSAQMTPPSLLASPEQRLAAARAAAEHLPVANLFWSLALEASTQERYAEAEAALVRALQCPSVADQTMHFRIRIFLVETICERVFWEQGSAEELMQSRAKLRTTVQELLRHRRFDADVAQHICRKVSEIDEPELMLQVVGAWRVIAPGDPAALQYKASAQFAQGAWGPAIETLDQIQPDARTWRYSWQRSRALELAGSIGTPDRVITAAEYIKQKGQTAVIAPTDARSALELARLAREAGKKDESARVLDEAMKNLEFAGWSAANWYYARGCVRQAGSDEAIADLRKAVELRPKFFLYRKVLARALRDARRHEEALSQIDEASKTLELSQKDRADLLWERTLNLWGLERYVEALQAAVDRTKLSDTSRNRLDLGAVLIRCGLHDEADRITRTLVGRADVEAQVRDQLARNERAQQARAHAPRLPATVIQAVTVGSPAERFGLHPGDVLLSIGGTEIGTPNSYHAIRIATKEGVDVPIRVQRGPDELQFVGQFPLDIQIDQVRPRCQEATRVELPF